MADERAVRQALDRSSEAIRVGQLQSLLRVQVELHEEAERESRTVKLELIRLIETVAPDQADADLAAKPPLESLSAKELISILKSRLAAARHEADRPGGGHREGGAGIRTKDYEALRSELGTVKEKLSSVQVAAETIQRDLNASREQNEFLIEERKRLLEKLARFEGAPEEEIGQSTELVPTSPAETGKGEPDTGDSAQALPRWLADWQDEGTFETDKQTAAAPWRDRPLEKAGGRGGSGARAWNQADNPHSEVSHWAASGRGSGRGYPSLERGEPGHLLASARPGEIVREGAPGLFGARRPRPEEP